VATRRFPRTDGKQGSPKYLFAELGSPYEITLALERELKKELAAISKELALKTSSEELISQFVERYTVSVPILDRNAIREFEPAEAKLQVPRVGPHGVFLGPGPHSVDATVFRIKIPFTGDVNLFRYSAVGLSEPIEGQVVGDALVLAHVARDPNTEIVKRELSGRLDRIEAILKSSRDQFTQWNDGLMRKVKPAIEKRMKTLHRVQSTTLGFQRTAEVEQTLEAQMSSKQTMPRRTEKFDLFLSHAAEDKDAIARPLHNALVEAGVTVWFDEAVLNLGDRLRRKINGGLARCTFGIIIISLHFLNKEWPRQELDALAAREVECGRTIILPIWHEIDKAAILQRSPMLADRCG